MYRLWNSLVNTRPALITGMTKRTAIRGMLRRCDRPVWQIAMMSHIGTVRVAAANLNLCVMSFPGRLKIRMSTAYANAHTPQRDMPQEKGAAAGISLKRLAYIARLKKISIANKRGNAYDV